MPLRLLASLLLGALLFGCADPVPVAPDPVPAVADGPAADARGAFPDLLPLPDGFKPEGIVTGRGTTYFVGSFSGAVYRGDLRTGAGGVFVPPDPTRTAIGLGFDARTNYVYVAGGGLGTAYVYDADTGATVGVYALAGPGAFVNDVIVTREAAYFTDSFRPVLYRLPLGPGGRLPAPGAATALPLGGDFVQAPGFNVNGIEATPDGKTLVIVQSATGMLFRVNPATGTARRIDLGGGVVQNGDGLLLQGRTLYVAQNVFNRIAVVALAPDLTQGAVVRTITDPAFRVPTTVAGFGNALYAVNARFDAAPPPLPAPGVAFEVVRVRR